MSHIGRIVVLAVLAFTTSCAWLSPEAGPRLGSSCDGGTSCGTPASDSGYLVVDDGSVDAGPINFARDIRPLMDRHEDDPTGPGCRDCHYNTSPDPIGIYDVGLDMTTLGSLRKGGDTTKTNIVIPGDPADSDIIQKLKGTYPIGVRMPKSGPPYWTDAQIQLFADWIAQGAVGEDSE